MPRGEPGEICVQGPLVMAGYWKKPAETEEALHGGWLHTGDIAREDEHGFYTIVDRKKDMIVSGGFNVFPREIEDVLAQHPAVSQCAVIGVPDEKWGEAVKAIVVLRPGRDGRARRADRAGEGAQGRAPPAQVDRVRRRDPGEPARQARQEGVARAVLGRHRTAGALMRTVCITGSAGGIGAATRARLEKDGDRVIGVDVRDAEVIADLSTPAGRAAMVAAVDRAVRRRARRAGRGRRASWATSRSSSRSTTSARSRRSKGCGRCSPRGTDASAVAISSNSTTTTPGLPGALVDTILAGDETAALAATERGARLRRVPRVEARARRATCAATRRTPDWIGAGIRLNAIAPGVIETPMTKNDLEFIFSIPDVFPVPIGRPGRPEEIASLLTYLLSPDAGFFCGSVVFADGGTDATVRADDYPTPRP